MISTGTAFGVFFESFKFVLTVPLSIATWYQVLRARQDLRRSRDLVIHSENCLEFVAGDGACVNLIPLEAMRTLPRPGDVVLLPGGGVASTGAWRIERVEHIYTPSQRKSARPREARLTKAMAHVVSLHEPAPEDDFPAGDHPAEEVSA
jgi:hypothetical protein